MRPWDWAYRPILLEYSALSPASSPLSTPFPLRWACTFAFRMSSSSSSGYSGSSPSLSSTFPPASLSLSSLSLMMSSPSSLAWLGWVGGMGVVPTGSLSLSTGHTLPHCSAAYWAECERHRGGAVNANERETGDLLPSAVSLRYTTRGLEEKRGESGDRREGRRRRRGARGSKLRS